MLTHIFLYMLIHNIYEKFRFCMTFDVEKKNDLMTELIYLDTASKLPEDLSIIKLRDLQISE